MRHALVIDDMAYRHREFRRIFASRPELADYKLHHAFTVAEALAILREAWSPGFTIRKGPDGKNIIEEPPGIDFSVIFLDHDCDETTGPHFNVVVQNILANPQLLARHKPLFFIHSQNVVGAMNMQSDLKHAGYTVKRCPFEKPYESVSREAISE